MADEAAAWLAQLDDAHELSDELLGALFGDGGDGDDGDAAAVDRQAPTPSAPSAKKPPPRKRSRERSLLQRLRLEAADLETVRALLLQRRVSAAMDVGRPSCAAQTQRDLKGERAWKAAASRQLQRRSKSQLENQQLRSSLRDQLIITQQLVRLLERAQRSVDAPPVARPLVPSDVVTRCSKRRAELLVFAWQTLAATKAVVVDPALSSIEHEFSQLTVKGDLATRREIPSGTILGGGSAGRIMPCAPDSIINHLWKPRSVHHAPTNIEYNDHTTTKHVTHYTITVALPNGCARLLGVSVRVRDVTRDVMVSVNSMWPDANMPYPFNSVGYTTRDWIVAQRDPHIRDHSRVLIKTERMRFVHELGVAAVTRDEAEALRHSVGRANAISLEDLNRHLDSLLLGSQSP